MYLVIKMKIQVHALHKSGSMFLHKFFRQVALSLKTNFYSINEVPNTESLAFKPGADNFIVSPIRSFPDNVLDSRMYIFVLRNPLDVLISQYYSLGWMHPVPYDVPSAMDLFVKRRNEIQSMGSIDEYCLAYADELLKKHDNLLKNWNTKNVLVTLYSEMVCDFQGWCKKISYVIPFDVKTFVNNFKHEFDVVPELTHAEIMAGKKKHKRKMLPDDHINKLTPETIRILNEKFSGVLDIIDTLSGNTIDILQMGAPGGGEWFIPDIFNSDSNCFCIGTSKNANGTDISFDIILNHWCDANIWLFDPSPSAMEHYTDVKNKLSVTTTTTSDNDYWNILNETEPNFDKIHFDSVPTLTVKMAMEKIGITKLDLLKLTYNAEAFINQMLTDNIQPMVLCVQWEFYVQSTIDRLLKAGYRLIHEHNLKQTYINEEKLKQIHKGV